KSFLRAFSAPAGGDWVQGDAAARQSNRKIADQRLHGGFRGAHGHPGLPAAEASTGSEGDGDDPSAIGHKRSGFANGDEERLSLGIDGGVPFFEGDLHGSFVEGG